MNDYDAVRAKYFEPYGTQRPNTGLWTPDANTIALTIGGVDVFRQTKGSGGNSPRLVATGGVPVRVSTEGNDTTPAITEEFVSELFAPGPMYVTGFANFNGSAVAGNLCVILYDKAGAIVASTAAAGVAQSGTDAYQRIAFSAPVQLSGGTYYVGVQCNNTSARLNTHAGIGNWGTTKRTGMTFGTFSALTPPTTFTANVGPMGSLY